MPDPRPLPVIFFRTEAGNEPVREWLRKLPVQERAIIGEDQDAAISLAAWHAARAEPGRRALGNTFKLTDADCPMPVLRAAGPYRRAARIY